MASFGRKDIRDILGDAYTDEIATKIVNLHRGVLDPLKDDLDSAKAESEKWKKEAEKVSGLETELADLKKDDWKAKYEKEHTDFEGYKTKVAQDAETAKVKAAYKNLLIDEKISDKTIDAVLAVTDYSKMKLKEDGTLDGIDDLKKTIDSQWGSFRVSTRKRGEQVDNPPPGGNDGGADTSIRERMAKQHAARFGALPETK